MDTAEPATFSAASPPENLVFVDVETTGMSPASHRIIEVGLVRIEKGRRVEQWSSLVRPESPIPPQIESFTGISNDMVSSAPAFVAIARELFEKLGTNVLVAHNARFDHAFLHREFLRAGLHLNVPVLCTVKLSRRLYPEYVRHNLDAVMARHRIVCEARHRAMGDALVLHDLWQRLNACWPPEVLAAAAERSMLPRPKLPVNLPPEMADELPEGAGVYRYFAADGGTLFVGRSNALRRRILAQLGSPAAGSRDALLAAEVHRVDWSETAGELGAMLREGRLIKLSAPRYNTRVARSSGAITLQPRADKSGRVDIKNIDHLEACLSSGCFGVFREEKDALKALTDLARNHRLCLKIMGIENGKGSCLAMQMGKCNGACTGREPLLLHDVRVRTALASLKIKSWPFPRRIALREEGRDFTEYHLLEHWAYLGTARTEEELAALDSGVARGEAVFDADVYRILVRHLSNQHGLRWHELREATLLN